MGKYLPETVYTSEEIEERAGFKRLGIKLGLVKMLTGCETRHYAAENEWCSDLAAKAGAAAIEDAGLTPADIDAVIFGAITRDFAEPATVNRVVQLLGIPNCYAFDIFNACNAFIGGVDLADSLIKTGKAENVLVVCGEILSRWTKFDYTDKDELLMRAPVALSVGDGAGAFVISKVNESDGDSRILATKFKTLPDLWEHGVIWGGGVIYPHASDKLFVPGTVKALTDLHPEIAKTIVPEMLERSGWTVDDIDCFLPTQIANWVVKNARQILGAKEDQFYEVIKHTGNVGACNIPLTSCFAKEAGKIRKGSKIMMIGGAAGMSIGIINAIL
ncbi:MAG TPA: ketoacyl-ACP synthase III [Ruminococcus sp.]|nr:ketoacyl-ACP synthase III [Ruminococcus sp.]